MRSLNILNGEAFKEYYNKEFNFKGEEAISINECFADGELYKDIFSEEFFSTRQSFVDIQYGISPDVYKEKTISEMKPLINNNYDKITLWFDFDMFCQINLLTVMAYLDLKKFKGLVVINIIKQDFFYCRSSNEVIEDQMQLTSLNNYYNLYIDILIKKDFDKVENSQYLEIFKELPYLKSGVKLYRNFNSSRNEIKDYINDNGNKSRNELLVELIKNFNNYGLGDTQYIRILDEMGVQY